MKKVFSTILCLLCLLAFSSPAFAEPGMEEMQEEQTQNVEQTIESKAGGVHITAKGELPEGTTLEASIVSGKEKKAVDEEISDIRTTPSVIESTTYDIKLLSPEGEEIQPEQPLDLSFTFDDIDKTLDASVYHTDSRGTTEIPSAVEDNTIHAEVESFSYYTVEFTFGDKQYVLEGDGSAELSDILDTLGIKGNIQNVEVSDEKLLLVEHDYAKVWGIDKWYVSAIKPFDTEEWMDVTIDGIPYRIVLTDDQVAVDNGTSIKDIPGVVQGSGSTFAETIPVSNIWIDESKIGMSRESREAAIFIPGEVFNDNAGFYIEQNAQGASGYWGKGSINFDLSKQPLSGTKYDESVDADRSYNYFEGVLGTFKWENAALHKSANGQDEYLDVFVEYSDLMITFDTLGYSYGKLGLLSANAVQLGNSDYVRYGISITAKPYIMDKAGNVINGKFYYPMVDIDVRRSVANSGMYNASGCNNYSEQIVVKDGLTSNIYIPGGAGDNNYISNIDYDANEGTYLFQPASVGTNDGNTFYSGFITQVQNGDFSIRYYGSSQRGTNQMESYILAGAAFNHKLQHSTTAGGTIKTTQNGNHNGMLNDGSTIIAPTIIATATGQTVVYTFEPKPGYHLKEVWINNTDIDYRGGQKVSPSDYQAYDDDGDGEIDRYTHEFAGINSDNAIHVVWETQNLTIEKKIMPTGDEVPDVFTFEIEAWTDYAECSTCQGTGSVSGASCSACNGSGHQRQYLDFSQLTGITSANGNPVTFTFKPDNGYEFELAGDDSVMLQHVIPTGYSWEVEETGLGTNPGWYPVGDTVKTGHFGENDPIGQTATFTNKRKVNLSKDEIVTIRKVWQEDRPELRPEHLTMHLNRKVSFLDTGSNIRDKMTTLSGNLANITGFVKGTKAQYEAQSNAENIAVSGEPTYMWYSGGNIYYYSESKNIFLNKDSSLMFQNCTNMTDISGCAGLNTAFVENMFAMFRDCYAMTNLSPLAGWDTGNVTSMRFMFASSSLPGNKMQYSNISHLAGWDTKAVTDMGSMFRGGSITNVSHISGWNTQNVANMNGMFFRTKIDDATVLAGWDTTRVGQSYINAANGSSAVGDFKQMFQNINDTTTVLSTLPQWTDRPGTWTANSANYNDTNTGFPVAGKVNVKKKVYDSTASITDSAVEAYVGNEWIYEVIVPADGSYWDIYEEVPSGYTVSDGTTDGIGGAPNKTITAKAGGTATIYNRHDPLEFTVTKVWEDDSNAENTRPAANAFDVFVKVSNGLTLQTLDKTDAVSSSETGNRWTYNFSIPADNQILDLDEGLPGTMISHVPTEYRMSVDMQTYTITNRLPEKDIIIVKKWEDGFTGTDASGREVPVVTLSGMRQFSVNYTSDIPTGADAEFDFDVVRTGGRLTLKIDGQPEVSSQQIMQSPYHIDKSGLSAGIHTFDAAYTLPTGEEYVKSGTITVSSSITNALYQGAGAAALTYATSDDPSKWIKSSDDTWTYTITVSDDNMLYKAWESTVPDGYIVDYDTNNKYSIPYNENTAVITNEITKDLVVTKNVKGSLGDLTKEFEFTAIFNGLDANKNYGSFTADTNGCAEIDFKLKDDQTWTLQGVPASCYVNVIEHSSDHLASLKASRGGMQFLDKANHIRHMSLSTGDFQLLDDTTVAYTNTRNVAPLSGVNPPVTIWLIAFVGMIMMLGWYWWRRRQTYNRLG